MFTMRFTNNTEKLLIKKSLILFIVILILSQLALKLNIQLLIGLIIGYAVSIFRLRSLSQMVKIMLSNSKRDFRSVVVKYIFVQVLTIVILIVSAVKSIQILFAVFAGISIITLMIMINAFTEAVGLTWNNFE